MENYVFISFSSKNQDVADRLVDYLEQTEKIKCWICTRDIPAGTPYPRAINNAIVNCSCALLILSQYAQRSDHVENELELLANEHKPVIPCRVDDSPLEGTFNYYLHKQQAFTLDNLSEDKLALVAIAINKYVACNDSSRSIERTLATSNIHEHTFSDSWTWDSSSHWHASTCGHDVVSDKAPHNYGDDNVCDVCGYIDEHALVYSLDSDQQGYVVICSDKSVTKITIPSSHDGLPVTSIGYEAFKNCVKLTEVKIPNSIKSIEDEAFCGCSSLTSITIPSTVTSIGRNAFDSCSNLFAKDWTWDSKSHWHSATFGCDVVSDKTPHDFDGNVCKVCGYFDESAFVFSLDSNQQGYSVACSDKSVTKVIVPSSHDGLPVTDVGYQAFKDCIDLTEITIPSSVTCIYDEAFCGCKRLTKITIPHAVTSIGDYAFGYCTNLQIVTFEEHSQLQRIGDNAFLGCSKIKEIAIPSTVTYIGSDAFAGCNNLFVKDWTWDSKSHWHSATFGCDVVSNKTPHDFDGNVCKVCGYLDESAFVFSLDSNQQGYSVACSDKSVTKVIIPSFHDGLPVTRIGYQAFKDCTSLTEITIPSSVTCIYNEAFFGCSSLTNITIPSTVTSIGDYAFGYCTNLQNVTFEEHSQLQRIGDSAFSDCNNIEKISIPSTVTCIGSDAFAGCSNLFAKDWTRDSKTHWHSATFGHDIVSDKASHEFDGNVCKVCGYIDESAFVYGPDSNQRGYIVKCTDKSLTKVAVPSSHGGLPVTGVGYQAFKDCTNLTEITIPSSVTCIYNEAFFGCSSLTNITIPSTVTSIGNGAFDGCSSLFAKYWTWDNTSHWHASICGCDIVQDKAPHDLDGNVCKVCGYLDESAFVFSLDSNQQGYIVKCTDKSLTKVAVPSSHDGLPVTDIGYQAFKGCTNLTEITIPSSVTSIEDEAFCGCSSLTEITIPSSVTSIEDEAFCGCSSLTEITIPSSVTSIGGRAFSDCSQLQTVFWNATNCINSSNDSFIFATCPLLTTLLLSDDVETIPKRAFCGANFKEVIIPSTVTSIGKWAFYGCKNLVRVTFENDSQLQSIGNSAFYGCSNLTRIIVPRCVTSIEDQTFSYCSQLQTVTFENDSQLQIIDNGAFSGCDSLTAITMPSRVISIGNKSFADCSHLTKIIIPSSVTSIGDRAFHHCSRLQIVSFEKDSQLQSIGNSAFSGCDSLTEVTIPSTVTSIGRMSFADCTRLFAVKFEDSSHLQSIGEGAFSNCSNLTKIIIPHSVTSIGNQAFSCCNNLFGKSWTWNKEYHWRSAIRGLNIVADKARHDFDGTVCKVCGYVDQSCWSFSLNYLRKGFVIRCSDKLITKVNIPSSCNGMPVTEIDSYAFSGCSNLAEVAIPNSITEIGLNAFSGCSSLTKIVIPSSVTRISSKAFLDCSNLTDINIPSSVTFIGSDVFRGCSNLSYNISEDVKYLGNDDNKYAVLMGVVDKTKTSYTINNETKIIYHGAFDGCSSLKEITIPCTVTDIGDGAFSGCSKLKTVTYNGDSTLQRIGIGAFSNCSNLREITIPNTVRKIGMGAFSDCKKLTRAFFPKSKFWYYYDKNTRSHTLEGLEDAKIAAQYLNKKYCSFEWTKFW